MVTIVYARDSIPQYRAIQYTYFEYQYLVRDKHYPISSNCRNRKKDISEYHLRYFILKRCNIGSLKSVPFSQYFHMYCFKLLSKRKRHLFAVVLIKVKLALVEPSFMVGTNVHRHVRAFSRLKYLRSFVHPFILQKYR